MTRVTNRASSLRIEQLSVARRAAIARGWQDNPQRPRATVRRASISPDADPNRVRAFAQQVALATTGPVLRYSQRLELFALANDAGISRFDANLIIAAIEHRAGKNRSDVRPVANSSSQARAPLLLTAAIVQSMIVVTGWIMLMR